MRKLCWVALMAILAVAPRASAQANSQAPKPPAAKPHSAGTRPAYDPALLKPATLVAQAPAAYDVKFVTTKGEFTVHVTRAWAPRGADRFYNLVKHHYFDGASFFRMLPGFVVQFGMSAHPEVTQVWSTSPIKDDAVKQTNKPGSLTFATSGPNSRTTQVFINLGENARLDSMGFSPFGEVAEGMSVVTSIYSGYGDDPGMGGHGPEQGKIESQGKAYLDKEFPKLDSIKTATLVVAPRPGAAATPAPAKP